MKSSALLVWGSALLLALVAYGGLLLYRANERQKAETLRQAELAANKTVGPKLKEFTLLESGGKEFHSQDLLGEVWVASVFFTACPSVCLELNKRLAEIQTDPRYKDVKFVSITCDPRNDTPSVLASYARRFDADRKRWFFCTGEMDYIEQIARDMLQISVKGITHSERAIIIDRNGQSRGGFLIANPRNVADRLNFDQTLLECLAEPGPDLKSPTSKPESAMPDAVKTREVPADQTRLVPEATAAEAAAPLKDSPRVTSVPSLATNAASSPLEGSTSSPVIPPNNQDAAP